MIHSHSFHAPPAGWFLLVESTRHWEEDGSGALIQAIFLTQNASFSAYPVPCLHTLKVLNVSVLGLGLFKSSLLTPLLLHGNNMKRTSLWSSYGCEVWIPNLLVLVHWNLSLNTPWNSHLNANLIPLRGRCIITGPTRPKQKSSFPFISLFPWILPPQEVASLFFTSEIWVTLDSFLSSTFQV